MLKLSQGWILHDSAGALWLLDLKSHHATKIFSFHSGKITGLDTSPNKHLAATAGEDGTVRVFNYQKAKQLCSSQFPGSATCLIWAPLVFAFDKSTNFIAGC
jgi:WD40 repeat protein